jgi:hypothetical protein
MGFIFPKGSRGEGRKDYSMLPKGWNIKRNFRSKRRNKKI